MGRMAETDGGVQRVVIAERDRNMKRLLELVCRSDPRCEVVAMVDTGTEAIAAAKELVPDVIVLDVPLQGVDGVSVAQAIRRRSPLARIVICTSSGKRHDDAEVADDVAWVGKPFDRETFLATILGEAAHRRSALT